MRFSLIYEMHTGSVAIVISIERLGILHSDHESVFRINSWHRGLIQEMSLSVGLSGQDEGTESGKL